MAGRASVTEFAYADRLNAAMGYRSINQSEMAKRIGISNNSMSKLARGETVDPGLLVMRAIAIELDVSMDYLTGLVDTMERKP